MKKTAYIVITIGILLLAYLLLRGNIARSLRPINQRDISVGLGNIDNAKTPKGKPLVIDERTFGKYQFKLIRYVLDNPEEDDDDDADVVFFVAYRGGKEIYRDKDFYITFGLPESDKKIEHDAVIRIGTDITGIGVPNLVVSMNPGGAHSASQVNIFEIGENFRKVDTLDTVFEPDYFVDLDGDRKLEFVTREVFAYWPYSYATSPSTSVILRFRDGKYHPAPDLMKKPPPNEDEIQNVIKKIRGRKEWEVGESPQELWNNMLDLIYSGNGAVAWRILDQSWPLGAEKKAELKKEFIDKLSKSKYWRELKFELQSKAS